MGSSESKAADSKANRIARWRSTGIVSLREAKLKTFPDEVLDLDKSVRTLDLTQNKLVEIPMEISKLVNMQRLTQVQESDTNITFNVIMDQCVKNKYIKINKS
ncbi:hypothetical protein GOBAR_AA30042 [Gossypium barbadense]|uniref:Uncharacterized protein n=1 Tax=Gossypium barbadense TaxID=3634 RepID=A0A2P5WHT7_GOSBA|nr:hypothetical protein GOBAR_AA30042 [Gossypium barbadense]